MCKEELSGNEEEKDRGKGGDGVEINGNCSKEQKRISNYCKGNCSGGSSLNAVNEE